MRHIFIIFIIVISLYSCSKKDNLDLISQDFLWQNSDSLFDNKIPKYKLFKIDSVGFVFKNKSQLDTIISSRYFHKLDFESFQMRIKPDSSFVFSIIDTIAIYDSLNLILINERYAKTNSLILAAISNNKIISSVVIAEYRQMIERITFTSSMMISNNRFIIKSIEVLYSDILYHDFLTSRHGGTVNRYSKLINFNRLTKDFKIEKSIKEQFEFDCITNKLTNSERLEIKK